MLFKKLVRPEHLNHHGTLFGGYMLLWVDEYAYIAALEEFPTVKFVTRAMEPASFATGVPCGAILTFAVERTHVGRTSVTYQVTVSARGLSETKSAPVFRTGVTMCAIDGHGRKTPLPSSPHPTGEQP